ncbi:hypothetical protein BDV35DRAFT_371122 [Aspergillus flavus]|uniref:Uncharacterized protein n=1 Tax=Aspergillus flavus TaxID=5059 RepID=A0A5N6GGA8_ASPFL|nr:hypothetical protein BDV35DRAFT_371122 [Aspergillus flavus]
MHSLKRRAYPNRVKCPAMVKRRRILDSRYGVFEFVFGFGSLRGFCFCFCFWV